MNLAVAAELSTQQLLSNMQSQVEGVTQWSDNLLLLADRGINQGLLKMLSDMGPEGAGYVATFVEMSEEELQKANELFEQSLILPQETTDKAMEAYATAGKKAVEGFKSGMEESTETVTMAIDQMTQESLEKMKENLEMEDESGESQKTREIGESIDRGVGSGIEDGKKELLDTVSVLTAEVIKTSQNGLQTTTFQTIGKQVALGLEKGIRDGKSGVISAVVDICTSAISAARETLDINSPSKAFTYMGEMSGEGYIVGWKRKMVGIDAIIAESMPETSVENPRAYTDITQRANMEMARKGMEYESNSLNAEYAEVIAGAISNAIDNINIKVFMEGESEGVFKMVRTETEKFVKATGYNPLTQKEDK